MGFIQKISGYTDILNSMKNDLSDLKIQNLTSLESKLSKNNDSENDANLKSKTILSEIK